MNQNGEDIPEWVSSIQGQVKSNGHLHIWGDESASEVITSDHYVRLESKSLT